MVRWRQPGRSWSRAFGCGWCLNGAQELNRGGASLGFGRQPGDAVPFLPQLLALSAGSMALSLALLAPAGALPAGSATLRRPPWLEAARQCLRSKTTSRAAALLAGAGGLRPPPRAGPASPAGNELLAAVRTACSCCNCEASWRWAPSPHGSSRAARTGPTGELACALNGQLQAPQASKRMSRQVGSLRGFVCPGDHRGRPLLPGRRRTPPAVADGLSRGPAFSGPPLRGDRPAGPNPLEAAESKRMGPRCFAHDG